METQAAATGQCYNRSLDGLLLGLPTENYGPWEGPDGIRPTESQLASWEYVELPEPGEPSREISE